ncbi:MAG: hypothetical protein O2905_01530 [Proteobacteria bacterium]|nr:hypothetical protein [Pseudomonadota bacterium]
MVAEAKCAFRLERPWPFDLLDSGCQFAPSALVEQDGRLWCRFRLPPKRGVPNTIDGEIERGLLRQCEAWNGKGYPLDLTGIVLRSGFDLSGVLTHVEAKSVCLANSIIGEGARIEGINFKDRFSLLNAEVGDHVSFGGSKFPERATFSNARFGDSVSFKNTQFLKLANFTGCSFGEEDSFEEARFGVQALFDKTVGISVSFVRARFGNGLHFERTRFLNADFSGASIGAGGRFRGAAIEFALFGAKSPREPGETSASFSSIDFSSAVFGESEFGNRKFDGSTDFSFAVFDEVPNFHGCTFHSDVRFRGTEFRDTHSAGAPAAYRVLKQAMEGLRAHDEQAMFFALQQRSQRHQLARTDPVRWFSALYDLTTEYGQSLGRPLVALAMVIVGFASLYEMLSYLAGKPVPGDGLSFAIEQIARPFGIWSPRYLDGNGIVVWTEYLLENGGVLFRLLATAESVAGLALVALFLLALRRRFKLD